MHRRVAGQQQSKGRLETAQAPRGRKIRRKCQVVLHRWHCNAAPLGEHQEPCKHPQVLGGNLFKSRKISVGGHCGQVPQFMVCAAVTRPGTGPLGTDGIPDRLPDRGLAW